MTYLLAGLLAWAAVIVATLAVLHGAHNGTRR